MRISNGRIKYTNSLTLSVRPVFLLASTVAILFEDNASSPVSDCTRSDICVTTEDVVTLTVSSVIELFLDIVVSDTSSVRDSTLYTFNGPDCRRSDRDRRLILVGI